MESYVLPLLALIIAALGRRVLAGAKARIWEMSAEIAMDASMIGATACGTVFASPFLEHELPSPTKFATGAVLFCFACWVALLGNRAVQPARMTFKQARWNVMIGSLALFMPSFFFIWGYFVYTQ